jgi:hypothetical protein
MALNMKITVFRDVMQCHLVERYQHLGGTPSSEDGGNKFLQNVDNSLPYLGITSQKTVILTLYVVL